MPEPAPERTPPDYERATCEHAALRPRCLYDADGRCVMCCGHYHRFSED